jgi:hypothetical protein
MSANSAFLDSEYKILQIVVEEVGFVNMSLAGGVCNVQCIQVHVYKHFVNRL